jgi:hypothetical protein
VPDAGAAVALADHGGSTVTESSSAATFRKLAAMVFTCAVPRFDLVTRRRVLGFAGLSATAAALAPALAACSSPPPSKTVDQAVRADPTLGPLYTETVNLISAYDQAIGTNPELAPALGQLREEHRQHAIALAGLMGAVHPAISAGPVTVGPSTGPSAVATRPPAAPGSSPSAGTVTADLATVEKTAQSNAVTACLAATGERIAVLASIAASRSTHVAALAALR